MSRRLVIGALALAIIAALFMVYKPDQSSEQRLQPPQELTSANAPEESHKDFSELVQRAVAFEMAYNSRYPDDTPKSIRQRIAPYASPQFMSWVALEDGSIADTAFKESGESQEPSINQKNIYFDDFEDDPNVAYITMTYDLVRKGADGKSIFRIPATSQTIWVYDQQQGWLIYPPN